MERVERVRRALKGWDPLRILRGCSLPESEYDAHAPGIVALIDRGATVEDVAAHLRSLRQEVIGVPADHEEDLRIATLIREELGIPGA